MTNIETARLYLRPLTLADKDSLTQVLSDPDSMCFYPHPFSDQEVENWIQWNINNYQSYNHGLWAVIRKSDNAFLGDCGITMQNIDNETLPEIGFHIIKQYCNNGYASEAAAACRDYAFKTFQYQQLFSYTTTANKPSQVVAKKIGMKFYKNFKKNNVEQIVQYIEKRNWLF